MDDLDQQHHLGDYNKDVLCILTDKCEGEAYDKIKGLQEKPGTEVLHDHLQMVHRNFGVGTINASSKINEPRPDQEGI